MLKNLRSKILGRFFRDIQDYQITLDELKSKQKDGAIIVDARSEQEFDEGHLEGAINIPDYKINKDSTKILNDKNKEIVLYCEYGSRSKKAYKKLKKLGYNNVFELYGGLEDYV